MDCVSATMNLFHFHYHVLRFSKICGWVFSSRNVEATLQTNEVCSVILSMREAITFMSEVYKGLFSFSVDSARFRLRFEMSCVFHGFCLLKELENVEKK